ncbi:TPR repeat-containing protein YrrB [Salinivirga cyanobacteriivorans]|uniref:TPR repeat-containing protein YrrB n=1 Tax=Salinivirga cyanobacteriivorans TaxID=1307839 RepID=A0A0S2I2S4_9BACT|nr:tetratricopeptide repeat protein [Salinivirga cyanobacteriivorans]ALO16580.1 TPR repeat-containing protein YrrB [Salinivirga cyanobacteriivorans]
MGFKNLLIILTASALLWNCAGSDDSKQTDSQQKEVAARDSVQQKIDSLSKVIRETPREDTLFYQRANYHLMNGDVNNAINDMEIALKLNPDEPDYYLDLAEWELRRGESGIAKNLLEEMHKKFPENVEAMVRLANIYMAVEQYKEARTYLIKASRVEPENAKLYLLSSMIFQEMEDAERAIEDLYNALKYDPDYYDAHIMLGLINARLGKDVAIDHYMNAMRVQPDNPEAVYNLGMYYQENKQYEKAIETYKKGLNNIDSTHQHFLFNLGYILENYRANPDSAVYYYQRVIENYPEDYRAFYRIGQCHEAMGQEKKAMASYEMCLKINPDFDLAYNALSRLSEKYNKQRQ